MGGRSRYSQYGDQWAWIETASDSRIEKYGMMSAYKIDRGGHLGGAFGGGKRTLNYHMSMEYERRHGNKPSWSR